MRPGFHRGVLLAMVCIALFLPSLGRAVVGLRKETRVVLPARAMAEGGSWLVPVYQGEPRLRKPPLMYWIVAMAFRAAGTTEAVWAARLPSAAAALALALALYAAGARWIGRRRAFYGAGVAATSVLLIRHARLASPEAMLGLFVVLAAWAGYAALTGRRRTAAWIAFGVFTGLGFLAKGPAGIAIPLAAVLAFGLSGRAERARLRDWRLALAVACFALIAAPWYAAVVLAGPTHASADAAIGSELSETMLGMDHGGGPLYYVYQLPAALMPWGALVPLGAWALWRARHHRGIRFLLGWNATAFAILTLVGNKQIHYTLLLVPQGALAVGLFLGSAEARAASWRRAWARGYVQALLAAGAAAGVALMAAPMVRDGLPRLGLVGAGAAMLAVSVRGLTVRRLPGRIVAVWAAVAVGTAAYEVVIAPACIGDGVIADFSREARTRIARDASVLLPGRLHAATVEFYLHRPVSVASNLAACRERARPGDAVVVVEDRKHERGAPPGLPALEMRKRDVRCRLFVLDGESEAWLRKESFASPAAAGPR